MHGHVTQEELGGNGGLAGQKSYDAVRGWMTASRDFTTTSPAQDLRNSELTWDRLGNLDVQHDVPTNTSLTLARDKLYRLDKSSAGLQAVYARNGNVRSMNHDTRIFSAFQLQSVANSTNSALNGAYKYDDAGRMVSGADGGLQIQYTSFDKPWRVERKGAGTVQFG